MVDGKVRDFYDDLTEEERKKFSSYLILKYTANVSGSVDLAEYYLRKCNDALNRDFFAIDKHPKLQWLCASTVSPGMGTQFHQWVGHKKKDKNNSSKRRKEIERLHPTAKSDELDILSTMYTDKDIKAIAKLYGDA